MGFTWSFVSSLLLQAHIPLILQSYISCILVGVDPTIIILQTVLAAVVATAIYQHVSSISTFPVRSSASHSRCSRWLGALNVLALASMADGLGRPRDQCFFVGLA